MMWKEYCDRVPNVIVDNTNILSEGADDTSLRLRRRLCVHVMCPETCKNLQLMYRYNAMIRLVF